MKADAAEPVARDASAVPPFRAPYAPDDADVARVLMAEAARETAAEQRIDARATRLVEAIRAESGGLGGIEDFLREYSLSTKEGLALMVLSEALLRVPDAATADRLIEDKLAAADFAHHEPKSAAFLVSASAWALGIGARIIQPGETPENILEALGKRLGLPALRTATRQAMRILGSHFVLGQTIGEALGRAAHRPRRALLVRHARRGRAHGRGCGPLFRRLCGRDRGDRGERRQCGAARPARHLGQALGAASALRGGVARARGGRADPARGRSSPAWRRRTNSISRSMPKRPTASSCRSR